MFYSKHHQKFASVSNLFPLWCDNWSQSPFQYTMSLRVSVSATKGSKFALEGRARWQVEFWCWTGSPPCNPSVWPPLPPLAAPVALVALNNATAPRVVFASWLWPPGVFTVTVNTAGSRKWSIVTLSRWAPVCGHRSPPAHWSPAVHQLCGHVVWKHLKCFTAFGLLWTWWDLQN